MLLLLQLAACGGEAESDLTMTAAPVARVYELGESMYVRCVISNPKGRHVGVYSTQVHLSTDGGENTRLSRVHSPPLVGGRSPINACTRKLIEVWPIDVGLAAEGDKAKAAFNGPADVICRMKTNVTIWIGPSKGKRFSLWATCRFKVKDKLFEYDPPLDAELRRSPRLHWLQAGAVRLTKPEFQAVEGFAWANRDKPIGRNLLWRVAQGYASDLLLYYQVKAAPKGKPTFSDVVRTPQVDPKATVWKEGVTDSEGPRSDLAVKYLTALLEPDDGHFAHYEKAGVALVRQLILLGKEKEALGWITRVRNRLRATNPGYSEEVDSLHKRIRGGYWRMSDEEWELIQREPLEDQAMQKLLDLEIRMGGEGKKALRAMEVGGLMHYLEQICAQQIPVEYGHISIMQTELPAENLNTKGKVRFREYLRRALAGARLDFRIENGSIVIFRQAGRVKGPERKE
jgi:hypothetical protein